MAKAKREHVVEFLVDHTVDAVDGDTYAAGQVVAFDNPFSADHFVKRNLARPVVAKKAAPPPAKRPDPEPTEAPKES